MSKWIWHFGEFEIYHSMRLHMRRQQYGHMEPPVWKVYAPEPVILFSKKGMTEGGTLQVTACGEYAAEIRQGEGFPKSYGKNDRIELLPGEYSLEIRVANTETFPCLYVEGAVESGGDWLTDDFTADPRPAGMYEEFDTPEKRPDVFPFAYEELSFVRKEEIDGGILLDFGKETFAKTVIDNLKEERVTVRFGESREEALDPKWCVIRYDEEPTEGTLVFPPSAFRYLYISDAGAGVRAEYEYLPLEYRGSFSCSEDMINRVWDTAAYTFHLNSREFFLDGIKRDRWVWSGDAYQSLFVNQYLFFDEDIEKRTLIALGGKRPFVRHMNKITDYTFLWVMGLYEHYRTYGDKSFLEQIKPQLDEIMSFCLGRVDADGFVRARRGDWIFIDWADIDREGALSGEQILFARALECYADILDVLGEKREGLREQARDLQENIHRFFYDAEKKVFVDSYESGRRHVSRHCNLLAYLYLPCSREQKTDIYQRVICNDEVPQITTPYFKFYENEVHCREGNIRLLEDSVRGYYGDMLRLGATTLYEAFDPTMSGTEHYAMYGRPYEKSLCHAWSASPIYLLGAYRLGVRNTGIAYETFDVRPVLEGMEKFSGTVPVPGGVIRVQKDEKEVRVRSDIEGGTLWLNGESYILEAGVEKAVEITA